MGLNNEYPQAFERSLKVLALISRFGLTFVFSMLPGLLTSWLLPIDWAAIGFVVVAVAAWPAYWWVWGRLLRKIGLPI